MKIAVSGILHETQTSLPGLTDRGDFELKTWRGEDLVESHRDTNTSIGGAIRTLEGAGAELIPLVYTAGGVGPTVSDRVYEEYVGEMCRGLSRHRDGLRGVLLSLHGAMVTETREDAETHILRDVRQAVGDDVPIMVALDLHANLSERILDYATAVFGYLSSPHVDAGETGERAARALVAQIEGRARPLAAMKKPGMVIPSLTSATDLHPARCIIDRVAEWQEHPGVIDVSFFFGFAWADVHQLGASAVAVTNRDRQLAARVAEDLAETAWSYREKLCRPGGLYSVRDGVARAIERAKSSTRPILILDHADRMNDTTFVLRELLEQGAEDAAVPLLHDPVAAEACRQAGAGSTVSLEVGSRSSSRAGGPVPLVGTVEWVGEREYVGSGPMSRGQVTSHGLTAIVRSGGVWVQITSLRDSLIDTDPIEQYGYRVEDFKIVVSKSKTHFRAVYEEIVDEIVVVDAPAYSPADLRQHEYRNVPPGIYPITAS